MKISKEESVLLRAIAILMVVLYHFQYDLIGGNLLVDRNQGFFSWIQDSLTYINTENEPILFLCFLMSFCFIGVNIFFVLSGYSLSKKYQNQKPTFSDMRSQVMKILIPYWLAHPLVHFIDYLLKNSIQKLGFIDYGTNFFTMHSFSQYTESILLFPRWFSEEGSMMFVGTWWFVGIIIQFYLLFPLLSYFFRKFKALPVFLVLVGISFSYRFIVSLGTDYSPIGINEAKIVMFINFPARLSEFALGMYLARIKESNLKKRYLLFLAFVVLIIGFIVLSHTYTMFLSDFCFAFGSIIIFTFLIKRISGPLKKIFLALGKKSYYIYLYHEPAMKIILKVIFPNWVKF